MRLGENKSDKHIAMGSSVLKNIWSAAPDTVSLSLSHMSMKTGQGQFILVMAFPRKGKGSSGYFQFSRQGRTREVPELELRSPDSRVLFPLII